MTRPSIAVLFAVSFAAGGCPGSDPLGDSGAESSDSGDSGASTGQLTNPMTMTAEGDGSTVGPDTDTGGPDTDPGDSTVGNTEGTDGATTDGGSDETTGGSSPGYCAMGCEEAAECCPLGALNCPSETYPDNWACEDNICVFGGCANNDDCESILDPGQSCHDVEGTGVCFDPCAEDNDCPRGATCTGVADDGAMFCEIAAEPCKDDSDCNGAGICNADSGECYCEGDGNCTAETADVCVSN